MRLTKWATVADIMKALESDGVAKISGFGNFFVDELPEREGVVPCTGEKTVYPRRKVLRFKPGRSIRENINR